MRDRFGDRRSVQPAVTVAPDPLADAQADAQADHEQRPRSSWNSPLRRRVGELHRTLLENYPRHVSALARGLERYEQRPDVLLGVEAADARGQALQVLTALTRLDRAVQHLLRRMVVLARAHGASWSHIGAAVGTSRQAAYERFAAPRARRGRADSRDHPSRAD